MTKIYWHTVSPLLTEALHQLMEAEALQSFRLVGGTSLSLQMGHRMSIDIDLFSDSLYGSLDFGNIDSILRKTFSYVDDTGIGLVAMGKSYIIGHSEQENLKLDIYYTDTFIRPALETKGVRLATVEEIVAMKLDIIQRGGRKKDFWDIHELMDHYSLDTMLALHAERYPYTHEPDLIRKNLTDFSKADEDPDPHCLRGKYWELIKYDLATTYGNLTI